MLLSCNVLANGPGPMEVIVEVLTSEGSEELIVDKSIVRENALDVGGAINRRAGQSLIELPRESVGGRTRVWVAESELRPLPSKAA